MVKNGQKLLKENSTFELSLNSSKQRKFNGQAQVHVVNLGLCFDRSCAHFEEPTITIPQIDF